ncbi:MAG TPA: ATP-binding protein [Planctomycetota bacterium]|nr:ATP-binding protein [Planctomycetota bacterium]
MIAALASLVMVLSLWMVLRSPGGAAMLGLADDDTGGESGATAEVRMAMLGAGACILLALFLLARRFATRDARRITDQIDALVSATGALAAGKHDQVLPVTSIEELDRLTDTFDVMQQAIRKIHYELELRVNERTSELERSTLVLQRTRRDLQKKNDTLERTLVAAEAATRTKSEFLANMSHEIRTPLTAILGFADFLAERVTDAEHVDAVKTITQNGRHLLDLLNDILDLSKVEAGGLEVERERVPMQELVESVRKLMEVRAREKNLSLEVHFPGYIPETIETDPMRLRQILLNLVGNAIKFTDKGGILVTGTLDHVDLAAPSFVFSVMDSGIGMTEEQQQRLFQPFSQVDGSMTRRFGGTGLGLFISRNLARLLGGDIAVSSEVGQGSIFRVHVATGPLDGVRLIEPDERVVAPVSATEPKAVHTFDRPVRVLLAEDTEVNRRLVCYMLARAGAQVDTAENGRVAVEMFRATRGQTRRYDVILMDMQMPVMDGYEAAALLKQEPDCPPIVALTAHAMREDRERCLAVGCDAYATKPIHRPTLIETVGQMIARQDQPGA